MSLADHLAFLADAGGVDDDEGLAVFFESNVDAVAGGAGDFGDDDAVADGLRKARRWR